MSILIEGMEMPNGLAERGFVIRGDGRVRTFSGAVIDYATAVPVPPHGKLIDADKLADSFEPSDFWNPDAEDNCFAAVRIVHSAPTIIPAELPVLHGQFAATSEQEALKRIAPAEEGET